LVRKDEDQNQIEKIVTMKTFTGVKVVMSFGNGESLIAFF